MVIFVQQNTCTCTMHEVLSDCQSVIHNPISFIIIPIWYILLRRETRYMIVSDDCSSWYLHDVSMGKKEGNCIWQLRDRLVRFLRTTPLLNARRQLNVSDLFLFGMYRYHDHPRNCSIIYSVISNARMIAIDETTLSSNRIIFPCILYYM